MKCVNCGFEIENGSAFCENCGKAVNDNSVQTEQQNNQINADVNANATKIKKIPKKLIILLSAGAVFLIILICIISILNNRVSVENYIDVNKIEISGYSGYATVTSSLQGIVDYDGIDKAMGFGTPKSKNNYEDYIDYFFEGSLSSKKYIDVSCDDVTNNLKNGDTITITVNVDYDSINQNAAKKKLVGKKTITLKYDIKDLKEPQELNPFSCIEKVFIDESENYIDLKYKFKEENDFVSAGYEVSYDQDGSINVKSADKSISFDINFTSDTILDNIKTGEKVNVIAKSYNDIEQTGISISPESLEIKSEFIHAVKDESKIGSADILSLKNKIEKISESVVASQYYEYELNEESQKFEFSKITFLVKDDNKYVLFCYDAKNVKISDSEEIFINNDGFYKNYSSYGKIKDYETENTNQRKKIKKITLSDN